MRLIRLGALVGSVVLLVATSVSMVNNRSELRREQDARVTASVLAADQSIESTVLRAAAVVELANQTSDPSDLVRSFGGDVAACISTDARPRCTDVDLFALSAFGSAAAASVQRGEPVMVVDEVTDSVLIVSRREITTALRLPTAAFIDERAEATIAEYGDDVDIELSATPADAIERTGPRAVDGRRVVTDTLGLVGDGGSVRVTASIEDDVRLVGDGFAGSIVLLALGTVLMALAAWTFFLDRRSLERRATTDELTGLANRREFERITEESLLAADRFNTGLCLMLIDLNGFKQINDTLGHQFGDLVLRAAAERLQSAVRDTDVVGRWGGDEFVIMLPGIEDGSGVRASAERIGHALAGTPIVGDVTVTAAIGAALFPRHGSELADLISAADVAMYSAKSTGVTHRLADVHGVELAAEELRAGSGYEGPDRRRHLSDADADAAGRD
jgi:diguanylate cyclase (GGDEF)-like protein